MEVGGNDEELPFLRYVKGLRSPYDRLMKSFL